MAMGTLSITEAKDRFTELADRAAAEHDHFTVTRNGRPHVLVVSVAEWDELQETVAVLSDVQIRTDLAESEETAKRGDFTTEEEMQAILDSRLGGRTWWRPRENLFPVRWRMTHGGSEEIDAGKHVIAIRSIRHRADAYRT